MNKIAQVHQFLVGHSDVMCKPGFVFLRAAKSTGLVEISCVVLSSFCICSKKGQTGQTNMVAYVGWAINFKSDFRFDLRGCLEAALASKPHFLCRSPIDGSS